YFSNAPKSVAKGLRNDADIGSPAPRSSELSFATRPSQQKCAAHRAHAKLATRRAIAKRGNRARMKRRNRMGSAVMPIHLARTGAFKARTFVALVLAALLALGFARGASAQTHDLMAGRGRDVSLPVSCGAAIQPRFD